MIFVSDPYFQQLEREIEIGTPEGEESSRAFNEQIYLNVLTSFYKMAIKPYEPWRDVIRQHLSSVLPE